MKNQELVRIFSINEEIDDLVKKVPARIRLPDLIAGIMRIPALKD